MPRTVHSTWLFLPSAQGKFLLSLILGLVLVVCVRPAPAAAPAEQTAANTGDAKTALTPAQLPAAKAIPDLQAWSLRLAKQSIDLKNTLDSAVTPESIEENLPAVEKELNSLAKEITMFKAAGDFAEDSLALYEIRLLKLQRRLDKVSSPGQEILRKLIQWHVDWSAQKKESTDAAERMKEYDVYSLVKNDVNRAQHGIETALELITSRSGPMKRAVDQAEELQVRLYTQLISLRELIQAQRSYSMQKTKPPLYSPAFYTLLKPQLIRNSWEYLLVAVDQQRETVSQNLPVLIILIIVTLILGILIQRSGHRMSPVARGYPFTQQPVSSALFLCLILSMTFFDQYFSESSSLTSLLQLVAVLILLHLGNALLPGTWARKFFQRTLLLLALTIALKIIHLPAPFFRLHIIVACAFGVFFCLYLAWSLRNAKTGWPGLFFKLLAVVAGGMFIGELNGYDQRFIFIAVLWSLVTPLSCWIFFLMASALLELILQHLPWSFVQRNSQSMTRQLSPLLLLAAVLLFIVYLQAIWLLRPVATVDLTNLFNVGVTLFSIKITLGYILSVALILYITIIISRGVQTALLEGMMPKYNMDRGVQLSIARIAQYTVFLLGFLMMLRALGVEMTQLAILGGALGVGIGFGLQAIFNNFVSGLILLFERPIKVGDVIVVGQETGEVTSLGLRATIVRTYDNAEIVIPNANLITNQVTNWTLDERKVRLRLAVGVAYGSDTSQVQEILLRIADEHPQVLSKPKPIAPFLAFGPSSLDFELRVWIPEADDMVRVRSELNQEIEREFRAAGIAIPFPQTDLHLRSVDQDAALVLGGGKEAREGDNAEGKTANSTP